MMITNKSFFKGCLIASISHAIMTNVFPELSYEQSWDGFNYSIQNTEGLRGTITFSEDFCVGAIRNDACSSVGTNDLLKQVANDFPSKIVDKANLETLQYLLKDNNGVPRPSITSIFWIDNETIHFIKGNAMHLKEDFILFDKIILSKEDAIMAWKDYYDIDDRTIKLIEYLYMEKMINFTKEITLTSAQKDLIPGDKILDECVESLTELNIYVQ